MFGQTEGLFGNTLDLRELQKSGRLGRIDVEVSVKDSKTVGAISVPTGLNRATTALLAAALETIERVGPYSCKVHLTSIDDIREKRRKVIVSRAKQILRRWSADTRTDSAQALKQITEVAKVPGIVTYGHDNVPAGPEAASSSQLIIVEGRADVALLLKAGYKNGIAVNGVTVPKSVVDLTWKKEKVTALVDGDRVGNMILRELTRSCRLDFVAKAPSGREVEELSPSELMNLLEKRMPLSDYLKKVGLKAPEEAAGVSANLKDMLRPFAQSVKGKLTSFILGKKGKVLAEVPVIELVGKLKQMDEAPFIVMDGIVTQRLVDTAQSKKTNLVVGERIGELKKQPSSPTVATLKQILT